MNVEGAIKLAIESVQSLFSGSDYRLEEVELRDDGGFEITVSFREPGVSQGDTSKLLPLGDPSLFRGRLAALGIDGSRTYKTVDMDQNGQIKAVRMRQIVVG